MRGCFGVEPELLECIIDVGRAELDSEPGAQQRTSSRRDVLLNVVFASHRSWTSDGRNVPTLADYLLWQSVVQPST